MVRGERLVAEIGLWLMGEAGLDGGSLAARNYYPTLTAGVAAGTYEVQLNLVAGLENPTSENLARWIWASLKPKLSGLDVIQITETGNSGIIFRG